MMMSRVFVVIGALLVLGAVNISIVGKERIMRDGEVVFLDLAPRDPRSLMQGDYMTLRFQLAQDIQSSWHAARKNESDDPTPREGEIRTANVTLDERRVATLAKPDTAAPVKIRYRVRGGAVWLGTNAFFFEEGSEKRYAPARYGEFRLDRSTGEAVLVGLRNAELNAL